MVRGDAVVGAKFSGQAAFTARLMMYVLLAIVLMAMDHRGKYVPRMRAYADFMVEPIYHVVEWPIRALRGSWSFFQNSQAMIRKNKDQANQLLAQHSRLQLFAALKEENRRLRELLDGSGKLDIEFQFAELIDVDLDPFSHRVMIDRGKDRGVEVGQAVIDGNGVMGQVEEVDLHFSRVRLISDPNHALPVQINRTGLRTVAFGLGNTGRLSIPSLPREADVREGDLIVTSGLGNRFPGGYPVAVIESVDRAEGRMFAEAMARPLAALDRGREVLLLKSPPPQPLTPRVDESPTEGVVESLDEAEAESEGEVSSQASEPVTAETVPADVTREENALPASNEAANNAEQQL
ncbi:MAG: rod shape-determining protein MreC [Xanthomonadales bacterium]|nr:rod shape-determining protein MreC [Xanthomonadales bacterium]